MSLVRTAEVGRRSGHALRPEGIFALCGCVAALPMLAVCYVARNTLWPLLGISTGEPKFFDNYVVNIVVGISSVVISALALFFASSQARLRSFPQWRWIPLFLLFLLPTVALYWLPWMTS